MGKCSIDLVFEKARHMLMMLLHNDSPPSNIYVLGTKRQRPERAGVITQQPCLTTRMSYLAHGDSNSMLLLLLSPFLRWVASLLSCLAA